MKDDAEVNFYSMDDDVLAEMQRRIQNDPFIKAILRRWLDTEDGGAGVSASLPPRPPVLPGAADAKPLPPLDPEPEWRDP